MFFMSNFKFNISFGRFDHFVIIANNEYAINIQAQNDAAIFCIFDINSFVTLIDFKSIVQYSTIKLLMPLFLWLF